MVKGIFLGLLAYAFFSCCDALVKSVGQRMPIFEMGFFITLFSLYAVPVVRPASERWRDIFRMHRPRLVILRMAAGVVAGLLGVYTFTTLPLAEAYALIFLAPLFVTLLSIPFLGERIGWRRGLAVVVGFAGVLLVVRPGFRELSLGHLAAVGVSLSGATTVIVLRALGPTEKRITLMGTVMLAALAANFVLMLFDFRPPTPADIFKCAAAGFLAGGGHVLIMAALRAAPANRIAPGQYSQIVWAMILGSVFFGEFPDSIALAGIALVTLSGLFTFLREEQTGGRWPPVWTIVWTRSPRNGGGEDQRTTRSRP
ncbi:MAG: DMT family transporter [Propylenella sp.]